MSTPKAQTVLLVLAAGGGHYPQKQVIDHLRATGRRIVLVRGGAHPVREFDADADEVVEADVFNVNALLTEVARYAATAPVDAVLSVNEYAVVQTALLCAALGLKGLSPVAAMRCRNKYLARLALAESGIDQPRFRLVRTPGDLEGLGEVLGWPYILKPLNHGGSSAVVKIGSAEDAERTATAMSRLRETAAATEFIEDDLAAYWIAEEYAPGVEICVECVVDAGGCQVVAVHDKMVLNDDVGFVEPFFVTPPPRLDAAAQETVRQRAVEVLAALGFDHGVAHLEFRVDRGRPLLLEVNGRIGGLLVAASVEYSTGVSLGACLARVALGEPVHLQVGRRRPTGFCTVYTGGPGRIRSLSGTETVQDMAGLLVWEQWLRVGDVVPEGTNGDIASAMFTADTPENVYRLTRRAADAVVCELESR